MGLRKVGEDCKIYLHLKGLLKGSFIGNKKAQDTVSREKLARLQNHNGMVTSYMTEIRKNLHWEMSLLGG